MAVVIWQSSGYRVRTDDMNFILERQQERQRKHVTEKNPETHKWVLVGYYSSLSRAIQAIPDDIAMRPEVQTMNDLIARLTRLTEALEVIV